MLIRCLLYGFQNKVQNKQFDRHQKMKVWLAHRNNRTLQGLLSIKKQNAAAPCWKSLFGQTTCKCTMLKKFLVKLRALYVFAHQCYAGVFWKMDVMSGLELPPSFFLWSLKKVCKWLRSLSRWSGARIFAEMFFHLICWRDRLFLLFLFEYLPVDFGLLNCLLR